MDENYLVVIILTVFGSVFGFYTKLKKDIIAQEKEKNKPFVELNTNVIELNATIKFLNETIRSLQQRVDKHGMEIDGIKLQNAEHELRISELEKHQH